MQLNFALIVGTAVALSAGCGDDDGAATDTRADSAPDSVDVGPDSVNDGDLPEEVGDAPAEVADSEPPIDTEPPTDTVDPRPIVAIEPWIEICAEPPALAERRYDATIRWASYGVPYITADDLPSVVFGQSYAMTRDHICTLADQYVATRSERSRYFGAGAGDANINNDFGWHGLGLREKANCLLARMSEQSRSMVRAVAAGYNKYVAETAPGDLPEPCTGAEWVKPVSELDVAAYFLSVAERASGLALLNVIGTTQPPGPTTGGVMGIERPRDEAEGSDARRLAEALVCTTPDSLAAAAAPAEDSRMGSNGWGIGGQRSESGRGMLLVNPHFPWEGALRFYESHLTVPGELDVHGTGLVGTPTILIGFNENVAWTHTVSSSNRFTMYALTLDPTDPTVYLYESERRRMASHTASIQVKGEDGTLSELTRTFYQSHYGPMLSVAPLLWGTSIALTYRDANINNARLFDYWLAKDKATNLADFQEAYKHSGNPWVNTMYADRDGKAFYIDGTQVPHMSDEALEWWRGVIDGTVSGVTANLAFLVWNGFGAYLFDGSIAAHEWVEDDLAAEPGLIPYSRMPKLERADYIMNANDSHWMSNPDALLEGYSLLYGPERTVRSVRTRMNAIQLADGDDASGPDGKFSFEELKAIRTNGRAFLAEEWLADVVSRCTGQASIEYGGATVPIADACAVLTAWDGRATLDSVGPAVWREFLGGLRDVRAYDTAFAVPFDPSDPVGTPNTLSPPPATGPDPVLQALAIAVLELEEAGFSVDSRWGDIQYTLKGDTRLAVPGGYSSEGAMNSIAYSRDTTTLLPKIQRAPVVHASSGLTEDGYLITYGTSTVMAIEFTDDGVHADGLLTYSQSADPASPHFADQTELFAQDGWRKILLTEEDLAADPNLVTQHVTSD